MNPREEQDLERFIDEHLRKLPEQAAPETLMVNVLAAVQAQESKGWWKEPFTRWPRQLQGVLYLFLGGVFSALVALLSHPAEQLTASAVVERARALTWIGDAYEAFEMSLRLLFKNLTWEWSVVIGALFILMYCVSLAGVFALYRVASHPTRSR